LLKVFLIFIVLSISNCSLAQKTIYQDIFHGEAIGVGYDFTFGGQQIDSIYLNPKSGSLLSKFIILYNFKNVLDANYFEINQTNIAFNPSDRIVNYFTHKTGSGSVLNLSTGYINVTNFNGMLMDSLLFKIPFTPSSFNPNIPSLAGIFFLFIYENDLLPLTSISIIQNESNSNPSKTYYIDKTNIIDTSYNKHVGLAINTSAICDTFQDGSYIFINNVNVGLIGGNDLHSKYGCGTIGNFTFSNDSLKSLSDDNPNYNISGTDGIGNISELMTNSNSLEVQFDYQTPLNPNPNAPFTNTIWNMFLTHSTPCDTFTVNIQDKIQVCKTDSIQMQVTSAPLSNHTYEWEPQVGLSCYSCAQPYFTDTVSRWYTVRIWNNDTCSKVFPVRVEVVEKPLHRIVSVSATKCSDSSGIANVQMVESSYEYILNDGISQTSNIFNNLFAGNHNISVIDTNGCLSSSAITILETFPNATFTSTPLKGDVPLDVSFYNTSSGANNFIWYIEQDTLITTNANHIFNTEGYFDATLVVYDSYPWCSDTASVKIFAEYPFTIFAPSLHDDKDGNYQIYASGVKCLSYHLYNALWQIIYTKELEASQGYLDLWSAFTVAKGTYVFKIVAQGENGEEKVVSGKVVVI